MNVIQILALAGGIIGYVAGFVAVRLYFRRKEIEAINAITSQNPYFYYGFAIKENEDK